jgi:hypothetical protein
MPLTGQRSLSVPLRDGNAPHHCIRIEPIQESWAAKLADWLSSCPSRTDYVIKEYKHAASRHHTCHGIYCTHGLYNNIIKVLEPPYYTAICLRQCSHRGPSLCWLIAVRVRYPKKEPHRDLCLDSHASEVVHIQLERGGLWNCTIVFGILETKIYNMQVQLMIHFLGARAYLSQCLQKWV